MSFHPRTYPVIERALLPDVPYKEGDPKVRGRIKESDLAQITSHERLELDAGHLPGIEIMEIVRADGSVYYDAVTGPNCNHRCAACRGEVDNDMREFGRGAIGVFGDSGVGEMERLRAEMRQLAATFTAGMQQLQKALPAENQQPVPALPEPDDTEE